MSDPVILCVANQKGGVGKTTTAVNLSHGLVQAGKRTLLIDLDAQANCSSIFLDEDKPVFVEETVHAIFKNAASAQDLIRSTRIKNLDLLPANMHLAEVETLLAGAVDGFFRLNDTLELLQKSEQAYEYTIIDCPPNLGMLTVNSFVAASHLLVPLQTAKFSVDGLTTIIETAHTIQKRFNPRFKVLGALITIHNARTAISQAFAEPIKEYIHLFQTRISRAVAVEEAHMMQQTIFEYQKNSRVAAEYAAITQEVLDGIEKG